MPYRPFKLERYFARHEFGAAHQLSASDCESLAMDELLAMGSPETLRLWRELRLGYTECAGHPMLRHEVASLYEGLGDEDVVIAAPEEAIFVAMHVLLEPGDEVVAVAPAYQSLHEVARALGCGVTPWQLEPGEASWRLDLGALERAITERTRLIVLNFPHNPTGHTLTRDELDVIVEVARRRDLAIFSDEMYRLLEPDPALRLPPVCSLYERGISLSGLSKAFALPGLRLGWLATRMPGMIEKFLAFKDYTTICNGAPAEVLGIIALQAREAILARNLAIVRENTEVAARFFAEHGGALGWLAPRAGSVAFPRWLGEGSVEQFCRELLDREGVLAVPGSMFDASGSHFRLGLGRRDLPAALARVGAFLASCAGA
jgi:aspartate/methionine/tyrosine aminotransferase